MNPERRFINITLKTGNIIAQDGSGELATGAWGAFSARQTVIHEAARLTGCSDCSPRVGSAPRNASLHVPGQLQNTPTKTIRALGCAIFHPYIARRFERKIHTRNVKMEQAIKNKHLLLLVITDYKHLWDTHDTLKTCDTERTPRHTSQGRWHT